MVPVKGQRNVSYAYNHAGMGYQKKRMPFCNGKDTGLNVTWHESEPTSDWSFFAREFGEMFK
jgi:hypothetical protein